MRSITTQIDIDASSAAVWWVLTDFESYPEWNPFIRSIQGNLRNGSRLRAYLTAYNGRGMAVTPRIIRLEAEREFRWRGMFLFRGLFDVEHSFALEPIDGERRTRFTQSEVFKGILVPLFGGIGLLRNTELAFKEMNQALARRAETLDLN